MNNIRKIIKLLIDIFLLNFSVLLSFCLIEIYLDIYVIILYNTLFIINYILQKIYNNSWRFTGIKDTIQLIAVNFGLNFIIYLCIFKRTNSLKFVFLNFIFFLVSQCLSRFLFILTRLKGLAVGNNEKERVLIYGAGEAGVLLVKEAGVNPNFPYNIIGFLDDSINKN